MGAECVSWTIPIFFFNDTATTEIYTLSLHDALPISSRRRTSRPRPCSGASRRWRSSPRASRSSSATSGRKRSTRSPRSEEHTSELQSRQYLVCRLLLEKKNNSTYRLYQHLLP